MRLVATVVLTVVLGGLAACGGDDGLSEEEYRTRLDDACERYQSEATNLPQVVREEDLTLDEARARIEEAGAQFGDEIRELDPPGDLQADHDAIVAATEEEPPPDGDIAGLQERTLDLADLYDAVGATGCADGQRRAAEQIAAAG
jgi:hypothetical protein